MIDVVIVTDNELMDKDADLKSKVAFDEDNIMVEAFRKRGLNCIRASWDDESFDWSSTKTAVIRSTWGYSHKAQEFMEWIKRASKECILVNNREILLWNIDKKYLIELNRAGINTPGTHLLNSSKKFDPAEWCEKLNSSGIVIKPTISADAIDTFWLKPPFDHYKKEDIESAIQRKEMIVQPFMESIKDGEISLIFINGIFIHAMLKKPQSDDFRVQENYGGQYFRHEPTEKELAFGNRVLEVCTELKGTPVYARVDFCYDRDGEPALMELEAIEPQLWLPESKTAVNHFAEGVITQLY